MDRDLYYLSESAKEFNSWRNRRLKAPSLKATDFKLVDDIVNSVVTKHLGKSYKDNKQYKAPIIFGTGGETSYFDEAFIALWRNPINKYPIIDQKWNNKPKTNIMSKQELTEGQKRVRLTFNPSDLKRVAKYKGMVADAMDYLEKAKNAILKDADKVSAEKEDVSFVLREIATAQTSLQQGSSMGVGALTTDLAFATLGNAKVDSDDLEIKSGTYTKKPVSVEITTFEDFVEHGKATTANKTIDGFPNSFSYKGHPVTRETNTCYLIPTKEGIMKFTPDDVLITGVQGEIYPCKIDIFKATYTD